MNYQEALAYIYGLSDYERGGTFKRDRSENLPRERRLLRELGDPQRSYTNTLIAGTKGKGSTAALIERVLREAGLHTGLYTQPDLHTYRERIRVDGHLIGEQEVADLVEELQAAIVKIQQLGEYGHFFTYEVSTALALLYFARRHIDHAVLEVGLGGRLDATNVTEPLVSVITSISYDHMEVLGDTLTKIATEKGGIIKPQGTLVTSAQAPEALLTLAAICEQRGARMLRVGAADLDPAQAEVEAGRLPALSYRYRLEEQTPELQRFSVQTPQRVYSGLEIPLLGSHQLENATAALATLELLREKGVQWSEEALRAGFHAVHWPARLEVVGHAPTVVIDGAHNADSMQKLMEALRTTFAPRRLLVVLSAAQNKDLIGMVHALANINTVILTRMANPRAASIEQLHALFAEHAPRVQVLSADTSRQALDRALELAGPDDLICATGSLYLAAEALRWSAAHGNQQVAATIEGVDHAG